MDSRSQRSNHVYVFHDDGKDHPTAPFAAAAALARHSHRFYTKLVNVYAEHGYNTWGEPPEQVTAEPGRQRPGRSDRGPVAIQSRRVPLVAD